MMAKMFTLIVALIYSVASTALAQCVPLANRYLDENKVKALIHNGGDMWWDMKANAAYQVPYIPGDTHDLHTLFASGFWIGGYDNSGMLHVAGQTYRQNGADFYPGPVRTGSAYSCGEVLDFPESTCFDCAGKMGDGKWYLPINGGYEIYDPVSGMISTAYVAAPTLISQPLHLADGRIMSIGYGPSGSTVTLLDTATMMGSAVCTLAANHNNPQLHQFASGEVLIAGKAIEIFNPSTLSSVNLTPSGVFRDGCRIVATSGDSVLIMGGFSTGTTSLWYHHGTGAITAGPALPMNVYKSGIADLGGGKFLLAGSADNSLHTMVFDVLTKSVSVGPDMVSPIQYCAGTGIPGGDAFFYGNGVMQKYDAAENAFREYPYHRWDMEPVLITEGPVVYLSYDWGKTFAAFDAVSGTFVNNAYQSIWKLTRDQINLFIADHAAGTIDFTQYPDVQTWPAHGNTALGESAHLAPFIDVNLDGLYNPLDGDYPCIAGDQGLWWIFHDDGVHSETNGLPFGIQVEGSAYAFDWAGSSCPDSLLDYTTFYHYEITNRSTLSYHDVYLGLFEDFDLGNAFDDYIGCDSALNLTYAYNGDNLDEWMYGLNPPAQGTLFLNTPDSAGMVSSIYSYNDWGVQGNPENAGQYYNYLRAIWKDGTPLVNNGLDGYTGSGAGSATGFAFPGDVCPGSGGWTEISAGTTPYDRRTISATGPFDIAPGATIKFDFASIYARGTDNLESVCRLKEASSTISAWWKSQNLICFDLTVNVPGPGPEPTGLTVYPNPSRGAFNILLDAPLTESSELTVCDLSGKVLFSVQVPAGMQEVQADASHLAAGMYLVTLRNSAAAFTSRLILER